MHNTIFAARHYYVNVASIYHLSGLNLSLTMPPCVWVSAIWTKANLWIPKAQKEKRGVIFKRAEKYVKEYRDQEREKIRLNRLSKQEGTFYIPAEEKLVFVIRIKG